MSEVVEQKQYDEDIHPRKTEELTNNEGKSPFSQVSRLLTEDELKSPVTIRILLNQFDEYQTLKSKHEKLQSEFHEKDKRCAILEENQKGNKAFEIINATMLAIGPLLLGTLSYLIPECGWNSLTIIMCVAGSIMLLGGVITKFFVKG